MTLISKKAEDSTREYIFPNFKLKKGQTSRKRKYSKEQLVNIVSNGSLLNTPNTKYNKTQIQIIDQF